MAAPIKFHAIKKFGDGRQIAVCWKIGAVLTEDAAAVTCKPCLRRIETDREAEAEWQKARAAFLQATAEKGGR